jgi:hypothetical protein
LAILELRVNTSSQFTIPSTPKPEFNSLSMAKPSQEIIRN